MRNRVLVLLSVVATMVVATGAAIAQEGASPAFQRAQHLRRGINLSLWYAQSGDYSAEHETRFSTAEDFKLIKSLGFDHVRLPINPEPLIADRNTFAFQQDAMARLDQSVQAIQAAGLNVILDVHPEQPWKDLLKSGDDGPARFDRFWIAFATHYKDTDPEKVFFEVMNEPTLDDLYRWQGIQARAVATIRAVAPHHTILATAAQWGGLDGLLALEPVRDENVIYSFHWYMPTWFTHQGATWGPVDWVGLHGVPYPSDADAVNAIEGQVTDERARLWLARYGYEQWNARRIGMEIAAAAEWGQRRGVPVYCGEFGVFKEHSDPQMRAQWIGDVRTALESKKIGWAMWDYQTNFGLVTKANGTTTVDPLVLGALGLKR